MNAVFAGTPEFAAIILKGILNFVNIKGIITQEDKPYGRKKILKSPEVKNIGIENKIEIFQPKANYEIFEILKNIEQKFGKIDLFIIVAYGKILKSEVVNNYYCINVHGSVLPYFRGASPIQESILNNFKNFGLSIIKMNHNLDEGDILAFCKIEIQNINIVQALELIALNAISLLKLFIENIDSIKSMPQTNCLASYCKKITNKNSELKLEIAKDDYLKFLAFYNWPKAFIYVKEKDQIKKIKLNEIELEDCEKINKAGEILKIYNECAIIGCKKGSLKINKVTKEGKGMVNATELIRSMGLNVGDILKLHSIAN